MLTAIAQIDAMAKNHAEHTKRFKHMKREKLEQDDGALLSGLDGGCKDGAAVAISESASLTSRASFAAASASAATFATFRAVSVASLTSDKR